MHEPIERYPLPGESDPGELAFLEPSSATDNYAGPVEYQLKQELVRQANRLNSYNEGDLQDGYLLDHIDDGWVRFKGFSLGFVVHSDPLSIDITLGPDRPFIGHRTVFYPKVEGGRVIWVEQRPDGAVCSTPADVALYAIRRLNHRADHAA